MIVGPFASVIKKMVSFAQFNLMNDSFPPVLNSTNAFDVIFCRNVLMYFTPEAMREVIHRFPQFADDRRLVDREPHRNVPQPLL